MPFTTFLSLREALQYIRNVVITEKVVKHPDRAEADRFFNYPYAAIEEALSNAVYHRAYDEREPIEVRIEADRIEIVSFPGPDRSVTIEGLKSYRVSNRRYRNRRIGDFLKELHLTEGRNTGFKKILDALEANGSPKPEFETDDARTYFITRLFIHEKFLNEELKESQKGAEKEPKKGAERKKAILELLAKNPTMTQAQLMEQMELTRKQVQKTDYINCSVQYPNWWYLRRVKDNNPIFSDWAILFIDPIVATIETTQFCKVNAATRYGAYICKGAEAFRELFSANVGRQNRTKDMLQNAPTDDQAEVLVYENIPVSMIKGIAFENEEIARQKIVEWKVMGFPKIDVFISPELFDVPTSGKIRRGEEPLVKPYREEENELF